MSSLYRGNRFADTDRRYRATEKLLHVEEEYQEALCSAKELYARPLARSYPEFHDVIFQPIADLSRVSGEHCQRVSQRRTCPDDRLGHSRERNCSSKHRFHYVIEFIHTRARCYRRAGNASERSKAERFGERWRQLNRLGSPRLHLNNGRHLASRDGARA
jgi:hypothetical protein